MYSADHDGRYVLGGRIMTVGMYPAGGSCRLVSTRWVEHNGLYVLAGQIMTVVVYSMGGSMTIGVYLVGGS